MIKLQILRHGRSHKAYDASRAYRALMYKIKYSRLLHPNAPRADEACLYVVRLAIEADMRYIQDFGYIGFYSSAANLTIDHQAKDPREMAAYLVSLYDIMQMYSDLELIEFYNAQRSKMSGIVRKEFGLRAS